MLSDNKRFQIAVRCRPLIRYEIQREEQNIVEISSSAGEVALKNSKPNKSQQSNTFKADKLYDSNTTQEQIYQDLAFPIVKSVIEGQNSTILAYGKTAVGKTYTMKGHQGSQDPRGIIPRACEQILKHLEGNTQASVYISYFTVYTEEIRDLLSDESKKALELKEQAGEGAYVMGLSSVKVNNLEEAEELIARGTKNRSGSSNAMMNAEAYTGHTFFVISVQTTHIGLKGEEYITKGKLTLVDLAGSERSLGSGMAVPKDVLKTNSSLMQVISALANPKSSYIPYRNSKLTRLLQNSLDGSTNTVIIANISPAEMNYDETLAIFKVIEQARKIKKSV